MSDMLDNGSSGGARPLPSSESHDEFLELCALSTTETLSAEEKDRLARHLRHCPSCREALAQYQAILSADLPAASVSGFGSAEPERAEWSLAEAESLLFARLATEEDESGEALDDAPGKKRPPSPSEEDQSPIASAFPTDVLWRHLWWQYAAGLLLTAALGYAVYRAGVERGGNLAVRVPVNVPTSSVVGEPTVRSGSGLGDRPETVNRDEAQLAALHAEITKRSDEIASLKASMSQTENDLRTARADRASLEQSREHLVDELETAEGSLAQTRQQLEAASARNARTSLSLAALQRQVDELTSIGETRDEELAREQAMLDHDRDIRELMGSRNLYIAEVYDVGTTGKTQKPFGRVFYTKGKSLIFYAYDLDQQPAVRNAATFQAWGRRGPDKARAVNLGIFYEDNAANKRWILKADNPSVLSGIDAVFVTMEPHGGSPHPSGKPLLFAYLRIEPNHP